MPLLFGDFFKLILEFLLFSVSGFMILLVLVQRGKGGGLTGALGGMGGQSAFGAKAGDVFTKITVVTAIIWIFLCLVTIRTYTYVQVNTTAMKEFQYTKLLEDSSIGFGNEEDISSSLNLGRNPDDGPGATLSSKDSDADKKSGEEQEKKADDDESDDSKAKENAKAEDSAGKGDEKTTPADDNTKKETSSDDKKDGKGESTDPKSKDGKSEEKKPGNDNPGNPK